MLRCWQPVSWCALGSCRVGLDVFEDEPDTKPGLLDCDNAVVVPHIASASFWTRAGMVCLQHVTLRECHAEYMMRQGAGDTGLLDPASLEVSGQGVTMLVCAGDAGGSERGERAEAVPSVHQPGRAGLGRRRLQRDPQGGAQHRERQGPGPGDGGVRRRQRLLSPGTWLPVMLLKITVLW